MGFHAIYLKTYDFWKKYVFSFFKRISRHRFLEYWSDKSANELQLIPKNEKKISHPFSFLNGFEKNSNMSENNIFIEKFTKLLK